MSTVSATLTSAPLRVSNGSSDVHLSLDSGSGFKYAVSTTAPNKSAGHFFNQSVLNIGQGFSVWVWNDTGYKVDNTYSNKD